MVIDENSFHSGHHSACCLWISAFCKDSSDTATGLSSNHIVFQEEHLSSLALTINKSVLLSQIRNDSAFIQSSPLSCNTAVYKDALFIIQLIFLVESESVVHQVKYFIS